VSDLVAGRARRLVPAGLEHYDERRARASRRAGGDRVAASAPAHAPAENGNGVRRAGKAPARRRKLS
jgi:hypothetical protein